MWNDAAQARQRQSLLHDPQEPPHFVSREGQPGPRTSLASRTTLRRKTGRPGSISTCSVLRLRTSTETHHDSLDSTRRSAVPLTSLPIHPRRGHRIIGAAHLNRHLALALALTASPAASTAASDAPADSAKASRSGPIEEVVVRAEALDQERKALTSVVAFDRKTLAGVPALGEDDPIRTLELLPGVQAASDISSGLYVRGGGSRPNTRHARRG